MRVSFGQRDPSVVVTPAMTPHAAPLASSYISLAGLPNRLFGNPFGLTSVCSVGLFRATIEVGAFLNRQSFMINVAYDMRLRLKPTSPP